MTIAEKLFKSDPKTLFEIIVIYRLEELARLYFPDRLEDNSGAMREEEQQEREITRLMKADAYTGKVERRQGALTQAHRTIIK